MRALLAALLTAATLPVLPASDASKLVADVAGKPARPVVLHFWATWCEACRDEFPSIRRELLALPGRGVGVLLVSIDRPFSGGIKVSAAFFAPLIGISPCSLAPPLIQMLSTGAL